MNSTKRESKKYMVTVFKPCESDPNSMYVKLEIIASHESYARMNIDRVIGMNQKSDKSWFGAHIVKVEEKS